MSNSDTFVNIIKKICRKIYFCLDLILFLFNLRFYTICQPIERFNTSKIRLFLVGMGPAIVYCHSHTL